MSYDLALIRRFEAVHRLGSFSQAAAELGLTHSAMTKSIRVLEELWNVRLFERTTRSVTPTAAGRQLAAMAPELLAHAADSKARVLAASRRLSVVCGPAIIDGVVIDALLALGDAQQGATVEVESLPPELAIERLRQRRAQLLLYHVGSAAVFAARRDLSVRAIGSEPYHLICAADHPAAGEDDPDALLRHDWAVAGFDPAFVGNLGRGRRSDPGDCPFPRFRLSSQHACIELARSGRVVTLAPRTTAARACADGRLVSREMPGVAPFAYAAVTLSGAADPLVETLVAALAATAAAAPPAT